MEQYWMPSELDLENLRTCIRCYNPLQVYIRDCGGIREDGKYYIEGMTKVRENLEGRNLDFERNDSGLHILVDSEEVFVFPMQEIETRSGKGFSLAYERIQPTPNGVGRRVMLTHGINPYDPNLPEPRMSTLRDVLDRHLIEIDFEGRVDLEFHSWWEEPNWKFWKVVPPK